LREGAQSGSWHQVFRLWAVWDWIIPTRLHSGTRIYPVPHFGICTIIAQTFSLLDINSFCYSMQTAAVRNCRVYRDCSPQDRSALPSLPIITPSSRLPTLYLRTTHPASRRRSHRRRPTFALSLSITSLLAYLVLLTSPRLASPDVRYPLSVLAASLFDTSQRLSTPLRRPRRPRQVARAAQMRHPHGLDRDRVAAHLLPAPHRPAQLRRADALRQAAAGAVVGSLGAHGCDGWIEMG
jgi:hypothetical protein